MNTCTTPGHEDRKRPEHQWICGGCVNGVEKDLASVTALWDELTITLARQDVIGGDGGRKSPEVPLPFKPAASETMWVLTDTITSAAGDLADHLGMQFPLNPARWLSANVDRLGSFPEAGRLVEEIRSAVRLAYSTIDRPPDRLFAGRCPARDCEEVLYAKPGDSAVKCQACDAEYDVEQRRQRMLDAAAVLNVTKTTALSWLKLLMDREVPDGTWRSWRTRGRLHVRALSAEGQELFGFGDVRDLAIAWMARSGKAA
jgi:hypothetical protein